MRLVAMILTLLAALGVVAEEPADTVRALTAGLADDDVDKRDAAEAELLKLGASARPAIEAARDSTEDPETRVRLERVMASFDKPVWLPSIAEGLKAAEAQGRLLIVIMDPVPHQWTDDPSEGPTGKRLMRAIDEDIPLRGWLAVHFASVHLAARLDATARESIQAEGTGSAIVLFVSPKNGVRHVLRGWWSADRFRKECERALAFLEADQTKFAELRAAARKEIANELAANPHPPIAGRHSTEACSEAACILARLLQCYDRADTVTGKTGDEALKILHGER